MEKLVFGESIGSKKRNDLLFDELEVTVSAKIEEICSLKCSGGGNGGQGGGGNCSSSCNGCRMS